MLVLALIILVFVLSFGIPQTRRCTLLRSEIRSAGELWQNRTMGLFLAHQLTPELLHEILRAATVICRPALHKLGENYAYSANWTAFREEWVAAKGLTGNECAS